MTRKTGRERETEKEGTMLLERVSGTIVERGNAVEPRCFSELTEKVDIDRPCAGWSRQRQKERERGRKIESKRGEERGPDGSERDGVSQPKECFSWQRRGSGTGSVQSSQVSPREGDILLRGAHVPRSVGALRRAHRGPVVFRYSSLTHLPFFPSVPMPIASAVARGSSSSPDNAYPEARACARAHANPLCCL